MRGVLLKKVFLKISQISQENSCVGVSFRPANLLKRDTTLVFSCKFAKFLRTTILKKIYKRLLLFVSPQNTIANSSGEFRLDETLTECNVNFIKQNNFIRSNAAISFISKLKNVSLTFQLTFLLNFCAF